MFKKTCPWCNEKTTLNQLGHRPVQTKLKWYQFSRNLQVCPYCANPIKLDGKGLWFMLLALPFAVSLLIELLFGYDALASLGVKHIAMGLFVAGCLCTYYFSTFIKVDMPS